MPPFFCAVHPVQKAVGPGVLCFSRESRIVRTMKASQSSSFANPGGGSGDSMHIADAAALHPVGGAVGRFEQVDVVVASGPGDAETDLVQAVFEKAIGRQSCLSPQQRGILLLRVVYAMSVEDVCLTLSLSPSAYHNGMREAEHQLKAMLARERGTV